MLGFTCVFLCGRIQHSQRCSPSQAAQKVEIDIIIKNIPNCSYSVFHALFNATLQIHLASIFRE